MVWRRIQKKYCSVELSKIYRNHINKKKLFLLSEIRSLDLLILIFSLYTCILLSRFNFILLLININFDIKFFKSNIFVSVSYFFTNKKLCKQMFIILGNKTLIYFDRTIFFSMIYYIINFTNIKKGIMIYYYFFSIFISLDKKILCYCFEN